MNREKKYAFAICFSSRLYTTNNNKINTNQAVISHIRKEKVTANQQKQNKNLERNCVIKHFKLLW